MYKSEGGGGGISTSPKGSDTKKEGNDRKKKSRASEPTKRETKHINVN